MNNKELSIFGTEETVETGRKSRVESLDFIKEQRLHAITLYQPVVRQRLLRANGDRSDERTLRFVRHVRKKGHEIDEIIRACDR